MVHKAQFTTLLLISSLGLANCYIDPVFQKGLEGLQYEGCTSDEIMKWWNHVRLKDFPRLFPLCIAKDSNGKWPDEVSNFGKSFDDISDKAEKEYDPNRHSWVPNRFELESILPKKVIIRNSEIPGGILQNRQILSFTFKFKTRFKGFFVQPVVGPLGLPSGDFLIGQRCQDDMPTEPRYHRSEFGMRCSSPPRSSHTYPNVYVVDANKGGAPGFDVLRFSFRWTEAQCHETAFFQFMVVSTTDFNDYNVFLTPVFTFTEPHSPDTAPTRGYSFNRIMCDEVDDSVKAVRSVRIVPNQEYDRCIANTEYRNVTDPVFWETCPPGIFQCETMWTNKKEWKEKVDKWWATLQMRDNYKNCCEIGNLGPTTTGTTTIPTTPITTTTTTTTERESSTIPTTFTTIRPPNTPSTTLSPIQHHEKRLGQKALKADKQLKIRHGDLCIMVWLVFVPIANHIARFFKEFPDIESIGMGFWLIAHIAIHVVSLVIVWLSFGLVVGTGEDKLGNVTGNHLFFGFVCTFLQHVQYYTAIAVSHRQNTMFIYDLIHSAGSYLAYLLACVSIWVSPANWQRRLMCFGLFVARIGTMIVSAYMELKQDKQLHVFGHRAQFPVLQRIIIVGWPPLGREKIALLILTIVILLGLFVITELFLPADH